MLSVTCCDIPRTIRLPSLVIDVLWTALMTALQSVLAEISVHRSWAVQSGACRAFCVTEIFQPSSRCWDKQASKMKFKQVTDF